VLGRIGGLTPASLRQSVKQLKAQTVVLTLPGASDCDVELDDEMSKASIRELFGAFYRYR
jgi:hypothetical protein